MSGMPAAVREALADALALVLPVRCAGCDAPDVALCEVCRRALTPRVHRRDDGAVPVWAGSSFEGVPARVIRALKEDGRTGLARALAPALRAAVDAAAERAGSGIRPGADDAMRVVVVPVPTSRAAYRRRGFRVVDLVAKRAAVPVARLLRPARVTADQRGLTRDARQRNVAGSMRATDAAGCRVLVLVLDDVATTGATLAEAARALRAAGAEVVGAAVIAATPRRGAPNGGAGETGA